MGGSGGEGEGGEVSSHRQMEAYVTRVKLILT